MREATPPEIVGYWSLPLETLLERVGSTRDGLGTAQAAERLQRYGSNVQSGDSTGGSARLCPAASGSSSPPFQGGPA